ncbi:MAG: nitroreductase family protein [Anaerolineales bacterium]|nr:nitroreductase family protein [Anaerolineales bacterium]
MALIKINRDRCNRDHICVNECPAAVFSVGEDGFPVSDPESELRCISCGHCAAVCPKAALEWSGYDPLQLAPVVSFGAEPQRILSALKSRRSVRKFSSEPVSTEMISQILDTSRYAPSASNIRPVKWLHLHGRSSLETIAGMTAEAISSLPVYSTFTKMWHKGVDMITRGAPTCVLTYTNKSAGWNREDSAIAITYAEISAHALGLGTCWGGLVMKAAQLNPELQKYLGLQDNESVTGALLLGFPEVTFYRLPPRKDPDIRIIT